MSKSASFLFIVQIFFKKNALIYGSTFTKPSRYIKRLVQFRSMTTLSLSQLLVNLRRALTLNFPEPVWVRAEIAQAGVSRGHRYFDLVQKGEFNEPVAQAQAVLWENDFGRLLRQYGSGLQSLLQAGTEVRLQVRIDFHERYGLKLVVCDADPAYTIGLLAQQRQQTLDHLQKEGLLDRNRRLPLPPALQRIAVISSETAAGYRDFRQQLAENACGYAFRCTLFSAAMQGERVGPEVIGALTAIAQRAADFDAAVLIRGGGARLDLAGFDGLDLCRVAANLPLPLFTGIGHDSDEALIDLVAHQSLKTPTAAAAFIVQHNEQFESGLQSLLHQFRQPGRMHVRARQQEITLLQHRLSSAQQRIIHQARMELDVARRLMETAPKYRLETERNRLSAFENLVRAADPSNVLKRGYSLVYQNGRLLRSAHSAGPGDALEIRLADGVIFSEVKKTS